MDQAKQTDLATCVYLIFKGAADITQKGPRRMLAEMLQVKASQYNSEIVPRIQFSCSSDLTGNLAAKTVCREWSIHPEDNDFFRLPGFDPFKNPSCRMHATDHGIFKRLLDLSIFIISRQKANIKREFDDR